MLPPLLPPFSQTEDLIEYLDQSQNQEQTVKYLYFWGHTPKNPDEIDQSCLSQWFPACFTIDRTHYATAEHYMMAQKALLFNDHAAIDRILNAPHPHAAKQIGRQVQGFEPEQWIAQRFAIVIAGNLAKFQQNPQLAQFLQQTGDRVLVEASPLDPIWGIGLAATDRRANQPQTWQGLNLLGFALMQVRSQLASHSIA